jgi:DNA-binding response OmpR family regulator
VLGKVLIVEDEAALAALLSDVLRVAGYEVVLTTASRAAAMAVDVKPAAVVMDYLMPGLNGSQVVEQIRAAIPISTPPVILVTGLSNAKELAEEAGVAAYLRKPFDVDAFVRIVDRLAVPAEK